MKKIMIVLGILAVLIFSGCIQEQIIPDEIIEINSFAECVAAGNPVMESYPRQCRANGKTFTEVIKEPVQGNEVMIGGQRDVHGCLGPAGYTWDADVDACLRNWEFDENQKKAAKIAVESIGPDKGLMIIDVQALFCVGCFDVVFDTYGEKSTVKIRDWKAE